jgi:transposase
MGAKFIQVDRETPYLLPPSIQDWLPENHLARFVADIVGQLDLRALKYAYAGKGSKAYNPEMLLSLLFYGYATGVFASRKLERATYDSVAFRYIAANAHPDHDTIATFRKRFLSELKPLFLQILTIAHQMDVLKLGKVSLDGSKIKANASKHHALSWGHANKLEQQLCAEVEELLRLASEADAADIPDGMSIPEELLRRKERLAAIAKAKAEISRRANDRYTKEKAAHEQKMAERKDKERSTGKKPRGKEPRPPASSPKALDQVNLTDEESRIMPASGGGFKQAYNAQAGVDIETMLIVENHVSQKPNDKQEIEPALQELASLPEDMGKVDSLLTDNGYFSEANANRCQEYGITPVMAQKRERHHLPPVERFAEPTPLPDGADAVTGMKYRLATAEGRKLYAKRKCTVEPVFGIIKAVMKFRQFLLRGTEAVSGEWNLVCIAYNLKRLHVLAV